MYYPVLSTATLMVPIKNCFLHFPATFKTSFQRRNCLCLYQYVRVMFSVAVARAVALFYYNDFHYDDNSGDENDILDASVNDDFDDDSGEIEEFVYGNNDDFEDGYFGGGGDNHHDNNDYGDEINRFIISFTDIPDYPVN